jgi:hypothetical protein
MEHKINMTREDLEGLLGERIFDWQWEWVKGVLIDKKKVSVRREDLFTTPPDTISVVKEEIRRSVGDSFTRRVD